MADELDLVPGRLRAALPRLLLRMLTAGYSIESARDEIEARNACKEGVHNFESIR